MRKISAMLGSLIVTLVIVTSAQSENIQLKIPFGFNPGLPGISAAVRILETELPKINPSISVKIYSPGELVPPFEILDAVSTGKVNSGYAATTYWSGKIPAASLFTAVPFGPEMPETIAWYKFGNGSKLLQEMYDSAGYNVHAQICGIIPGATGGWFNKEINSPEDFQGLKVRSIGFGGRTMEKLGIAQTILPVSEIFTAMEKGVIDAVELSTPAVDNMVGLPKISKFVYFPGWQKQTVVFELLINKEFWNQMDSSQRASVNMACESAIFASAAESEHAAAKAMNEIAANSNTQIRYFSQEILDSLASAWKEVATEEASADKMFKKVFDDLSAYHSAHQNWSKNAYLRRD